jgi:transposase
MVDDDAFRRMEARLADLLPLLNERDRRVALAAEAKSLGRGGISAVHRAVGASRSTIRRGLVELEGEDKNIPGRVRRPGGGRKKAGVANPELLERLDALIEPGTRGDPESPLRWTTKSTRHLARELTAMGSAISHSAVATLLRSTGYSLQGTRKTLEGAQHPDRDAQFRYINALAQQHLAAGDPVISVDTKKKQLVGRFAQAGKEWQPAGTPEQVSTYDFPHWPKARPSPTASTTSPTTAPGSRSASTTTPRSSRWPPSKNGGDRWGRENTRTHGGCSSPPTAADRTDTAPGCTVVSRSI